MAERQSEKPGLGARRAATSLWQGVTRDYKPLDQLLAEDKNFTALAGRDRGFARAMAATALRHGGEVKALLGGFLSKPLPRSSGAAADILAIAAAQLLFMGLAPHAVIDCAVTLAKQDHQAKHFSGLINAVLRKLSTDGPALLQGLDAARLNTPDWLWHDWQKAYGEATARAIAQAHRTEAPIDLSVKDEAALWAERLGGLLLPTGSIRLMAPVTPDTACDSDEESPSAGERLPHPSMTPKTGMTGYGEAIHPASPHPVTPISELTGYQEGAWWVQDAAAALPALLFGRALAGKTALDLCAAPGGKTAQLAAAGATVTAVDDSPSRLQRLRENLSRLNLKAEVLLADVLALPKSIQYDLVLLDAPCSATGTIRRHPDLLYLKSASQMASLVKLQRAMLTHAADIVKPGGTLVYSVCSLLPREGEEQMTWFQHQRPDFALVPVSASDIGGESGLVTPAGFLRALPSMMIGGTSGLDGFFAARFNRKQ